jgi:hypothetical protein
LRGRTSSPLQTFPPEYKKACRGVATEKLRSGV